LTCGVSNGANLAELRIRRDVSSRCPIFYLHSFGQGTDSGILVVQEPSEGVASFVRNDPIPGHATLKITTGLPVSQLLGSKFRAISANMASMTATRELLVRSPAITRPTIMTR
jgi:hypothetical protein